VQWRSNGTNLTFDLFVNGNLAQTLVTQNASPITNPTQLEIRGHLGHNTNALSDNHGFAGAVADFRISSVARYPPAGVFMTPTNPVVDANTQLLLRLESWTVGDPNFGGGYNTEGQTGGGTIIDAWLAGTEPDIMDSYRCIY